MRLRCVSWNVLHDNYVPYEDYSHTDPTLLLPGARRRRILEVITALEADVLALQEADVSLAQALYERDGWHVMWTPKTEGKPDGCIIAVRRRLRPRDFTPLPYDDGTGYVAQCVTLDNVRFVNTHIKWAPRRAEGHVGVAQVTGLLEWIGGTHKVVLLGDYNDTAGGPIRAMVEAAGFKNAHGLTPTAYIKGQPQPLDLIAVRGVEANPTPLLYRPDNIPSAACPSDHVPVVAIVHTR